MKECMKDWTDLINAIKELLALNPKILWIIVVFFGLWMILVLGKRIGDKLRPDLPYKHSIKIDDGFKKIGEHLSTIQGIIAKKR